MKKLFSYFVQGIAILIPVVITLYIIIKLIFIFVDFFVWIGITGNLWLDIILGLLVMVIVVISVGALTSNYFFGKLMHFFETQIEKLPLIRHIYSPIKDFTEAFVGNKKKFKYPVLIKTSSQHNFKEIGFITQQDLSHVGMDDYVAVYIPFSYSFTGKLILIKKEQIEPFNIHPTDAMKFIVSGGIYEIENKK